MANTIVVRNHFHGSSVKIRANVGDTLTEGQVDKAIRELCGMPECKCGALFCGAFPEDDHGLGLDNDYNVVVRW